MITNIALNRQHKGHDNSIVSDWDHLIADGDGDEHDKGSHYDEPVGIYLSRRGQLPNHTT